MTRYITEDLEMSYADSDKSDQEQIKMGSSLS